MNAHTHFCARKPDNPSAQPRGESPSWRYGPARQAPSTQPTHRSLTPDSSDVTGDINKRKGYILTEQTASYNYFRYW
jgi:hypothetical protein